MREREIEKERESNDKNPRKIVLKVSAESRGLFRIRYRHYILWSSRDELSENDVERLNEKALDVDKPNEHK